MTDDVTVTLYDSKARVTPSPAPEAMRALLNALEDAGWRVESRSARHATVTSSTTGAQFTVRIGDE